MAKISLRDYLNGIEELIDNRRTEEALAHCRHILSIFPKNIATYQLMGKTYLESHKHMEASDIFQRVLSSIPDDFVSHIGMSIIREETGDLDGSIWNMERAFEAQPSNRAVQEELRRLYGKREGYAPPKVRLTRGALARMYAHGDLYNQAIGELRAALAEDQQRPDLQILLTEMYYQTKRETEAIDICSKLINKLPYCLYANRLMNDILRANHREAEAKTYAEKVEELDPYAALVDTRTPVNSAPAESVMLEQLVYEQPVQEEHEIPRAWTGSLELESSAFEKEELPDWLSVDNVGEEQTQGETSGKPSELLESLESLEPIPTSELGKPNIKRTSAALSDDQVPAWLRELRPSAGLPGLDEQNETLTFESDKQVSDARKENGDASSSAEMELEASANEPSSQTPSDDDESLEWLEKLAAQQGAPEEELLTTPEARQSAKPDWLPKEYQETKQDSLAWLDEIARAEGKGPEPGPAETRTELPPDQLSPFEVEENKQTAGTTPTWLKELGAEVIDESSALESDPDQISPRPLEEAPDWLNELRPSTDEIKKAQEGAEEESAPAQPEEVNSHPLEAAPDWLNELRPSTDEIQQAQEAAEEESQPAQPEEISPRPERMATAWLNELTPSTDEMNHAQEPADEKSPPAQPEEINPRPLETASDWLDELGPPKETSEPVKSEWLPEMPAEKESRTADQTPPVSVPVVSPRRTAALLAEQEAPGRLEQARQALNYGKLNEAADHYGYLLHRRLLIKDVIADLDAAVHRHPGDATLWQTLGDAYMRNNQLREALDCYTRAEDLL